MKNLIQDGNIITIAAPYARVSGEGALVGSLFGVCTMDAASAASVDIAVTGVYDVTKLSTDVVAAGALLYWDDTNKRLTVTASTHKLVGLATRADGSGNTTARILLKGGSN